MKLIVLAQWLTVFTLLPAYSFWILRADEMSMERAIVYAMEQTNTQTFFELESGGTSASVCTLTEAEVSILTDTYTTSPEFLHVEGQSVTIFHFVGSEPTMSQLQALFADIPSDGRICTSVYRGPAPYLFHVSVS